MDPYVLSIIARNAGEILSNQAAIMERVLSQSLQEPGVTLHTEFGSVVDNHGDRHKIYMEADAESLEIYALIGPERESMLVCLRSGKQFIITGGSLSEAMPADSL